MSVQVISREVLHFQDGTSDKVYIVERLKDGTGKEAHFISYGRRGAKLSSQHVPGTDAAKKFSEKMDKGYEPKTRTVGLTPEELDMSQPLTDPLVIGRVLSAAGPSAAPASAPAPTVVPAPMELDALESEFGSVVRQGSARTVQASAISEVSFSDGVFQVQGTRAQAYRVTLNPMTCECPAFATDPNRKPCKHLVAVIKNHGETWIRAKKAEEMINATGLPTAPAPVQVVPPAVPAGPVEDPVMAIFAPFVLGGESHPLVPLPEQYEWKVEQARQLAVGFRRKEPTMLFGPTGTGKTAMARTFGHLTNRPLLRINCTRDTTKLDIIGRHVAKDGSTYFEEGPLPLAMRYGYILVVDEADKMDPGVSSTFFSAMEEMPTLTLKEGGAKDGQVEVITAHPDFWIVLTANSLGIHDEDGIYTGSDATDAALISRCGVQIEVGYAEKASEFQILVNKGIDRDMAEKITKASVAIRALIENGTVKGAWGTRQAHNFAKNARDLGSYEAGFAATARAAFTRDEFKALWQVAQRPCGS